MNKLICPNCKNGKVKISEADLHLKRGAFEAEIKRVPAQVCQACGEVFIPGSVAEPISKFAEAAFNKVTRAKRALQPTSA